MNENELAIQKMRKGICAVCDRPIKKHTKSARKVCYILCQKRYGIGKRKVIIEGREVEVGVMPKSLVDNK